jgi:hypothetical protein
MKKILYSLVLNSLILSASYAQTTVQAAIKPTVGLNNGVTIFLKSPTAISGKATGVTIALALPVSVGVRPIVSANNAPNTSVVYIVQNTIDQIIQGVPHYVYNLLGTGDAAPGAITYSLVANVESEIVRATFSGNVNTSQIKIVNLPDGGTDPNPNSFFGFSVDGGDKVNETAMFYTVPTISTAQNEIIPGGYSGLSLTITSALIALPVKFTSFSATKNDNDAFLSWVVENETTLVTTYEVERSIDGIKFDKINTIAKNTGASNIYNIIDPNLSAVKNNGIIYYRIKQMDVNGEFVYSDIRNVRLEKGTLISTFPNPVVDITTVKIDVTEAIDATISLINADGKQLQAYTLKAAKGLNLKKVDMNNLPKGDYLLKVTLGTEVQTIKVIKL